MFKLTLFVVFLIFFIAFAVIIILNIVPHHPIFHLIHHPKEIKYFLLLILIILGIGTTYHFSYSNNTLFHPIKEISLTRKTFLIQEAKRLKTNNYKYKKTTRIHFYSAKYKKYKNIKKHTHKNKHKNTKKHTHKNIKKQHKPRKYYKYIPTKAYHYWYSINVINIFFALIISIIIFITYTYFYHRHRITKKFKYLYLIMLFAYIYMGFCATLVKNHYLFLIMVGYSLIGAMPFMMAYQVESDYKKFIDLVSIIGIVITFASTAFSVRIPFGAILIYWSVSLVPIVYLLITFKDKLYYPSEYICKSSPILKILNKLIGKNKNKK